MMPLFSVVIPVFNRAGLLRQAIASVLSQTEQDFEIIVVDDGSSDDPQSVVSECADARIVFVRQPNRGGGPARNTGIDLARGRFVAFLDSDDRFLPHHLAAMRALLESNPGSAGYARMVVDRGDGVTILKPPRGIAAGEDMANYLMCDRGFVPTSTVVVERAVAQAIRYPDDLAASEDTDFAIRAALAGTRFLMIEEPGAICRDLRDPARLSSGRRGATIGDWLEGLRPSIPARAYFGCRGWSYAKFVATRSRPEALKLYLTALGHRCYRPSLAVIIFLQIFLSDDAYRRLADGAISHLGAGLRRVRHHG
ncbi:MAG: glycosyltransferase family 2 protein [Alphaproteobacteria bacterium]|nr:glycosyltransferase family 2 protein [Alphaproteobacteria bacterium]